MEVTEAETRGARGWDRLWTHAYYLELLNGSGTSMAILIALTTFERPTLLISEPSLLLPWTCDNYGLVLFSVVAECNVYNKSSLLLS